MLSSMACFGGNAQQSHYGFANSVMERVCERRRRDGLHGLAIQWGPVGDVGYVCDTMGNESEINGYVPQRIHSCLEVLDQLLQSEESVICSRVRAVRKGREGTEEKLMYNII